MLESTRTLVWNGPFGAFEIPPFEAGTVAIAKAAARLTQSGQLGSVAGGGDTIAALNKADAAEGLHLYFDGRRRFPRVARRQAAAGRRGPAQQLRGPCDRARRCANCDGPESDVRGIRAREHGSTRARRAGHGRQGKGILAADESAARSRSASMPSAFDSTAETRRDYRELLFRTRPAMDEHISGVILYDETIRQKAADGTPLVKLIEAAGSIPGIKVDTRRQAAGRLSGRDHHRGARWSCRPARRILRARRPFREMARGHRHRRRHSDGGRDQGQCACACPLCGALPGGRYRADRRAGSADGRRPYARRAAMR